MNLKVTVVDCNSGKSDDWLSIPGVSEEINEILNEIEYGKTEEYLNSLENGTTYKIMHTGGNSGEFNDIYTVVSATPADISKDVEIIVDKVVYDEKQSDDWWKVKGLNWNIQDELNKFNGPDMLKNIEKYLNDIDNGIAYKVIKNSNGLNKDWIQIVGPSFLVISAKEKERVRV